MFALHGSVTVAGHLSAQSPSTWGTGRRIGQHLMGLRCEELVRTGQAGYLETDRPENVSFYRRFGFETTDELLVLGVRNHIMWREAWFSSTA